MSYSSEFRIVYDGKALQSNAMDVRDLAPALLAFGKLFDEANRVLNGNKTAIRLQVKATAPGSFDIFFHLNQSVVSQITTFLTSAEVTSAANLITMLGFGATLTGAAYISFLGLVKKLRGQMPSKLTDLKNGMIQIEFGPESFTVPLELLRLYQDVAVRKATQEILDPLKSEGIEVFKVITTEDIVIETITKTEVIFYELPEIADELILERVDESAYSIVSLAFKDDNKWRLYDGNSTISVTVSDEDFRYKVDNNLIAFSKGDILFCKVRTMQYRTGAGLKTEYEVLQVKEHRPAARQLSLFEIDGKAGESQESD